MLRNLRIRDFAIIDFIEVELEGGMCVFTGETGAGKSIIIDALGLILGGRAYSEYVRAGADEARIEALFDVNGYPHIEKNLDERGVSDKNEVVISRTVAAKGSNRADVNGRMFSVGVLAEIAGGLADIYGQHEHHSLLRPESHLEMLDGFGKLFDLRGKYRAAWRALRDTEKRIEEASKSSAERAARLDYLKFVVSEINAANPVPGELEQLKTERDVLRNAGMLAEVSHEAYQTLYGADDAMATKMAALADKLRKAASLDPKLGGIADTLESSRFAIEDAAEVAREYAEHIENNPRKLEEIEDRLELLGRLCKKYGGTLEAVVEYGRKSADEISRIEGGAQSSEELHKKRDAELKTARALAEKLSEGRRDAAEGLRDAVQKELKELGMGGTKFEVRFYPATEHDGLGADGEESAEFFIAPNVGEDLKPLIKIASGGELSRIMLALKTILVGAGDVPTLVFDEVDAGVGGAAAEVVGKKMKSLSKRSQVLCVTHLAQIAAFAQSHYLVMKTKQKGRTVTRIKRLDDNERVEELARMLGGVEVTDATRALAKEMMRGSRSK